MNLFTKVDRYLWRNWRSKLPVLIKDWPTKARIKGIKRKYRNKMGYSLNYKHPALFTEKLQRYKLQYDRRDFPNVVDKYLFKAYIAEKLGEGYTIPLYGAWDSMDDFQHAWDSLPNEFVLKSTLQSDGKFIKIIRNKQLFVYEELSKELKTWLNPENTLINSYCRAYYRAKPRILAEQYVVQKDNQVYDYKVFCFDGKPHCFYVATDHFPGHLSHISFYDLDWNLLDVRYGNHPQCSADKPTHFAEMLKIAKVLSKDFPFVRVDFFDIGKKLYVAELTLYPGAGMTPYDPESFNRELGDLFVLPEGM